MTLSKSVLGSVVSETIGTTTVGSALVHQFNTAGTYTISATVGGVTRSMVVEVCGVSSTFFEPFYVLAGNSRTWNLGQNDNAFYLEADGGVTLQSIPSSSTERRVYGGRAGSFVLLARLEEGGPVVARSTVKVFKFYSAGETGGGVLIDGKYRTSYFIEGPVPPTLVVRINIWYPGATFADTGTTQKDLTPANFYEGGVAMTLITASSKICQVHKVYLSTPPP